MCVDRRAQVVLVLVVLTTANALLSLESKSSEVKRNDEQFQSFLRNTNNVFDSDFTVAETFDDENDDEEADDESGSGEEIIDKNTSKKSAQPYHNNSTFLLLSQAKDMLNHDTDIFPHVSKSNTVSLYNGLSRLNATLLSDNKRHHEKHKKRNSDYLLTVFDEKPSSGHQDNKKTTDNKNSKNSSLQIANLTLDRSGEELSLNHPALVKYKHRKMNKTGSVSFSKRPRKNHFVNYYKVMGGTPTLSLTQTLSKYNKTIKEISDKLKGKHTSGVVTKSRHGELSNKFTHKNGTKRNDLNELKEKLYETLKTDNTSATKTNDSKNYQESEENQKRKEREQDPETSKLQHLLSKLKFNNGATGKVRTGQEFAYISQCGLYTEPQNVSFVEHAWVTKTYSPYFYLYEKPKKYEKCKPSPWMNGTDMRGSVFLSFEVKSLHGSTMENNAKICEKYCCKEPRCAAWVLRLQSEGTSNCPPNSYCCWLKTDIPKPEPHEACVSGIVHRNHYKHPPNGMRSSVPLGALGTGSFELRADGTFHEWTIENQSPGGSAKLSKTSLEMMLLGVRVKKGKGKPRSAVLRTHAPHGYEGVESIAYSGSHPVSKLKIDLHKKLRKVVNLDLYAYSTFHPRSPKDSATPSVVFSLSISNPSNEDLDVSFMLNLPFGYNDDTIRRGNNFAEVAFTRLVTAADCQNACAKKAQCMSWTTNGPFSCMLKDGMPLHAYEYGIISGLKGVWEVKEDMLNCKRPGFYPQSGDISLYPINHGSEVTSFAVEDDPEVVWDLFKKTGNFVAPSSGDLIFNDFPGYELSYKTSFKFENRTSLLGHVSNVDDRSKVNSTGLNGAVSTSTRLRPKERKTLTIIFSWYFPNRGLSEERVGNFYNNLFKNSLQVAKHTENDLLNMVEDILNWQSTFIPPLSISPVKEMETKHSKSKRKCTSSVAGINTLPDCLQDILLNSLSTLRTGMWMENGRWRQWEAFDCANMDPVHVDFHRIIPYVIVYPEIAKQVMLAWGDHQLENGMIQESLSMGCLEETSKEGVAGGRMMTDVNVGFIVQAYLIYSWTNDTSFFDEIYPFAQRAMDWLIKESTKGTDLPYRKPDTYDLFELEKYDHCAYNSILYLLALSTMKKMSKLQKDEVTFRDVSNALERAEKRFDIEMWDDKREFYHAWFDDEWGSPSWLMSDVMYGQVWAYTLGIGELVDKEKIKKHLRKEEKRNDSPYGLKALTKSDNTSPLEDTSVILGDELNSCKSLENITKTESIWMSSSTDWSTLQLYLGLNPKRALEQASKSLDNYRSNLRDQWNFHGLTSSEHYGLDGLPWATSHYTFHLVLWHLPMALSGQQYFAPDGKLSFTPKYEPPYWLPFYTPQCMGNIEAKEIVTESEPEIMYGLKVSSGICLLRELSISDSKYAKDNIIVNQGETIKWSAPKKTKKDIVKEILDQLKH